MTDETVTGSPQVAGRRRARLRAARLGLLALLGLGLTAAGAALVVTGGDEDAETVQIELVAGADRPVTVDPGSIDAHNSPALVQSPDDPNSLVVADKVDLPRFSAAVHVSRDGGEEWTEVKFPTPRGEDRPYAPDLAWSSDGTLFMAFVTLTGSGNSPGAVWITSSEDGGSNWARPRRVLGPHAFQVRLAVDPGGRLLHMTWLQASEDAISCVSCFAETGLPILAARSADGGKRWTEPARVSSPARMRVGAAVPVVARTGELYVLFYDFKDDRFLWQNLEGAGYNGTYELVLARGRPGGRAFEERVVEPGVVPEGRFPVYLPKFPSLALDEADGTLYAAWADRRSGDRDVFLRRSGDGGASWSEAVRANPASGTDSYLPKLAIAPDGRVDLAYLDRRMGPEGGLAEAALATSYDAGQTWSSVTLSSRPFDVGVGPGSETGQADQGTRLGLVSRTPAALAVWTDARMGTRVDGRLDVFSASVRFSRR